ncbi:hypothetical protein BD410DRAFT_767765 [Rickenella mellea]|uniref:Novel STAND NTPase 1 domain-containing protein n=1 Tax=Rickenella mellea TaxID=50990 RepID=A0A4Y7Q8J0_9AGAM|nr:hypothetical protein BD410DRAFT_767765 [Rickenella mellea]
MARARPSNKLATNRIDQALAASKLALAAMVQVTDGLNVPFLKAAPQMVYEIINLADTVKGNKDACTQLAIQATDLIKAMVDAAERGKCAEIDEQLANDMEDLGRTLESIRDFMEMLNRRGMFSRIIASNQDGATVAAFRTKLNDAVQVFQIKDQISFRISQQVSSDSILQVVKNIHDHQLSGFKLGKSSYHSELHIQPPASPENFYGRDDYTNQVIHTLLTNVPARLAILGPGGVGKTSVAAAVFHNPRIKDYFQNHRTFISCEALLTADSLTESLCRGFDLSIQDGKPLKTLLNYLQSAPQILLVLDNFETLWDADNENQDTLKLLRNLSTLTNLHILMTIRGILRPPGISWTEPVLEPLPVLSVDIAKMAYLAISPTYDHDSLEQLLEKVGYLPLAINLLANLAQMGFSPSALLAAWVKEQTRMLTLGGKNKLESLDISISLSVRSPLLERNSDALSLLRIISYLPGGTKMHCLADIASHVKGITEAQVVLFRTGLIYWMSDTTLNILSPIRYYVLNNMIIQEHELQQIHNFYFSLTDSCKRISPNNVMKFKQVTQAVGEEKENLIFVLDKAIQRSMIEHQALQAVVDYSEYLYWTVPSKTLLLKAIDIFKTLPSNDMLGANLIYALGKLSQVVSDNSHAKEALTQAMEIFQKLGDREYTAHCLRRLGDIARTEKHYVDAHQLIFQASDIYQEIDDKQGAALALRSLGDVAKMQGHYYDAKEALSTTLAFFESTDRKIGVAKCLQSLGDVARMQQKYEDAKESLTKAMETFQEVDGRLGAAECLFSLAEVAKMQEDFTEARNYLHKAITIFKEFGDKSGENQCSTLLEEINQHEQ